ncbi:hypothetical protein B0H11DRAFT_1931994 [Mycena galericulata]|nr:hypothetical protein B0H11DRAFT_1931994 [Mycena galericulata]
MRIGFGSDRIAAALALPDTVTPGLISTPRFVGFRISNRAAAQDKNERDGRMQIARAPEGDVLRVRVTARGILRAPPHLLLHRHHHQRAHPRFGPRFVAPLGVRCLGGVELEGCSPHPKSMMRKLGVWSERSEGAARGAREKHSNLESPFQREDVKGRGDTYISVIGGELLGDDGRPAFPSAYRSTKSRNDRPRLVVDESTGYNISTAGVLSR